MDCTAEPGHARFLVFDLQAAERLMCPSWSSTTPFLEVRAVAGDNSWEGRTLPLFWRICFFEKHRELDRLSLDEKTVRHIHKQAELCKMGFTGCQSPRTPGSGDRGNLMWSSPGMRRRVRTSWSGYESR